MAYTQTELEAKITALETALARGVTRVDYSDRSVTYRSVQELQNSLSYFQRLLSQVLGTGRSKQTVAVASKGF